MRRRIVLTAIAVLALVTTTGLWAQEHAEVERAQVVASLESRAELRQQLEATLTDRLDRTATRRIEAVISQIDLAEAQLLSQRPLPDPDPVLRPATVLPALVMVGTALLAVRWLEGRQRRRS